MKINLVFKVSLFYLFLILIYFREVQNRPEPKESLHNVPAITDLGIETENPMLKIEGRITIGMLRDLFSKI
ncbi:hypothetical protein BpHYR1_032134 [Brachionus plicatilis]|uniref:Uncharacterized protein n=1 Tax=Brachionus plicatilis TaxID=10195 RepID=A0A3M7QP28_BRAPC|nr:hypothetical protein BpHYR1_032134 [Brachionus plicatilis]